MERQLWKQGVGIPQQLPQTLVPSGAEVPQHSPFLQCCRGAGMGWEPEQQQLWQKGAGLLEKSLGGEWSLAEPRSWQLPLGSRLAWSWGRKLCFLTAQVERLEQLAQTKGCVLNFIFTFSSDVFTGRVLSLEDTVMSKTQHHFQVPLLCHSTADPELSC